MSARGPGPAPLAGLPLAALLAASLTCSYLAEGDPPKECSVDSDCEGGFVCGGEGLCYAAKFPPRSYIGLAVLGDGLAPDFHVELRGDDSAVLRIDRSPIRYSVSLDDRKGAPGVRDELRISLRETVGANPPIPLAGEVTLSQDSRLGRAPATANNIAIAIADAMGNPIDDAKLVLPWARYDRDPLGNDIPLLLTVNATSGPDGLTTEVNRGPVHRQLVRPQLAGVGAFEFAIQTRRDCHRRIDGRVVLSNDITTSVPEVTVEFKFLDRPWKGNRCEVPESPDEGDMGEPAVCSPQTIATLDGLPECITVNDCPAPYGCHATGADDGSKRCGCDSDSQCPTQQICETTSKRCALDLAGLVAGSTTTDAMGYVAWVYTYCEDDFALDEPKGMDIDFLVTATPKDAAVPSLTYTTPLFFPPNDDPTASELLCLPPWTPRQPLAYTLASAPQPVYVDPTGKTWTCCSPACLLSEKPPPVPTSCPLDASVTANTVFTTDPEQWKQAGCMPLAGAEGEKADSQKVSYGPVELVNCAQSETPCEIALSAGVPGGPGLEYEVLIEPEEGSLVRSMVLPLQVVDASTTSLAAPPLEYRVLLRGRVQLALEPMTEDADDNLESGGCPDAEIMAERRRMPDEAGQKILGPYLYTAQTIPNSIDCEFVLPVNPGVYLVTALPRSGSKGGPAKISVLDLRLDSDLVNTSGPIPVADLAAPIVLEAGTLVTVELDNFDRSSVVVPLDLAAWKPIEGYPELDLNSPETCHGPAGRACEIRRLRPGKGSLTPTQERYVKYVTRAPAN